MNITLIAAMGKNGVIGLDDKIPWMGLVPLDMFRFRTLTLGKTVVMGRKTFESMGKPLKDRRNIVLTRNTEWVAPEGVEVASSIEEIVEIAQDGTELMIIGGAEIYTLFLPIASSIELTIIDEIFPGNVYFPLFNKTRIRLGECRIWKVVFQEQFVADGKNKFSMKFVTLRQS